MPWVKIACAIFATTWISIVLMKKNWPNSDIAYELISDSFGISIDGIERIVEQLQQTMPKLTITNGHILAFLQRELVDKVILDTMLPNP